MTAAPPRPPTVDGTPEPRLPTPAELAVAAPRLPIVLYDGACAFCTAQAERVRRVARGRLRVEPLQTAVAEVPWIDPDDAVRALHLVDRDGRVYAGAAAIVRLLRLTRPLLGLLVLPYHLPGLRWLADRAYAFVAARRYAIAGRCDGCPTGTCDVPWAGRDRGRRRGAHVTSTGKRPERSTRSSTPPIIDSNQGA
jgi:predicted DCC family thiol-disulfide oxidoreductase YuxK